MSEPYYDPSDEPEPTQEEYEDAMKSDWTTYQNVGTNMRNPPEGEWVRVSVSATGNIEIWACHELHLTQTIISD